MDRTYKCFNRFNRFKMSVEERETNSFSNVLKIMVVTINKSTMKKTACLSFLANR